ncbi:MAG: DUF952 domain-containing protein [Bacteroidota bacterium]
MIYHLATHSQWLEALNKGVYTHASLKAEGFIHCSTKEQLIPTATLHFQQDQELVILEIVEKRVKDMLKWEESREGDLFPHLYGKLPLSVVENTHLLIRNKAGEWEWS